MSSRTRVSQDQLPGSPKFSTNLDGTAYATNVLEEYIFICLKLPRGSKKYFAFLEANSNSSPVKM